MSSIRDYITKYKSLTAKLIEVLENEEYDGLEEIINGRQTIIDLLKSLDYNQNEFKDICDEFQIVALEQKAKLLMSQKHKLLSQKLNNVKTSKSANANYNKKNYVDSLFFNKKI